MPSRQPAARVHILLLQLVHVLHQVVGETLVVYRHGVAVRSARARARRRHGDVGQGIARLVPLAGQARNDAHGSVVLVEGGGQLLPRAGQLLAGVVRLEHQGVPLVLEGLEQRRQRREVWRARAHHAARLDGEEVLGVEFVVGAGLLAVLFDVLEDEAPLEDGACGSQSALLDPWILGSIATLCLGPRRTCLLGHDGLLGHLAGNCIHQLSAKLPSGQGARDWHTCAQHLECRCAARKGGWRRRRRLRFFVLELLFRRKLSNFLAPRSAACRGSSRRARATAPRANCLGPLAVPPPRSLSFASPR